MSFHLEIGFGDLHHDTKCYLYPPPQRYSLYTEC